MPLVLVVLALQVLQADEAQLVQQQLDLLVLPLSLTRDAGVSSMPGWWPGPRLAIRPTAHAARMAAGRIGVSPFVQPPPQGHGPNGRPWGGGANGRVAARHAPCRKATGKHARGAHVDHMPGRSGAATSPLGKRVWVALGRVASASSTTSCGRIRQLAHRRLFRSAAKSHASAKSWNDM